MLRLLRIHLFIFTICGLLLSCGDGAGNSSAGNMNVPAAANTGTGRWYTSVQREKGAEVFRENCSVCHGENAQGLVADWQQRLGDGSFPPPPLNGTAHAWHHPLPVLLQVINEGGIPLGGKMPAFADVLTQEEKLAAIAYFQQFWSDDIYQRWEQMGGVN